MVEQMAITPDERLWLIPELAEHLSVHPDTISRWIKNGHLDHIRLGGTTRGPIRIPDSAVIDLLARRTQKAVANQRKPRP